MWRTDNGWQRSKFLRLRADWWHEGLLVSFCDASATLKGSPFRHKWAGTLLKHPQYPQTAYRVEPKETWNTSLQEVWWLERSLLHSPDRRVNRVPFHQSSGYIVASTALYPMALDRTTAHMDPPRTQYAGSLVSERTYRAQASGNGPARTQDSACLEEHPRDLEVLVETKPKGHGFHSPWWLEGYTVAKVSGQLVATMTCRVLRSWLDCDWNVPRDTNS